MSREPQLWSKMAHWGNLRKDERSLLHCLKDLETKDGMMKMAMGFEMISSWEKVSPSCDCVVGNAMLLSRCCSWLKERSYDVKVSLLMKEG